MAATGVKVPDELMTAYNQMKLGKRGGIKYMIFEIANSEIVLAKEGTEDFKYFLGLLPSSECLYAVYDFPFITKDGRPVSKLVFISWSPDGASVKPKMIYAGSKDALTKALVGIAVKVHATDLSEVTEDVVADACRKF